MALDLKGRLANIPKRQLMILGLAAAAGIGWLYYSQVLNPLWETQGLLVGQLRQARGDLDTLRATAGKLPRLEAENKQLEQKLAEALTKLPEEKEIPSLLTQINTLGQQAGLEFLLFKPTSPLPRGFYSEVPIQLRIEGGYHALGVFFDKLSKMERIVNIADLKIAPLGPSPGSRGENTITAEFSAKTFTSAEKAAAAGKGAPAAKPIQ